MRRIITLAVTVLAAAGIMLAVPANATPTGVHRLEFVTIAGRPDGWLACLTHWHQPLRPSVPDVFGARCGTPTSHFLPLPAHRWVLRGHRIETPVGLCLTASPVDVTVAVCGHHRPQWWAIDGAMIRDKAGQCLRYTDRAKFNLIPAVAACGQSHERWTVAGAP